MAGLASPEARDTAPAAEPARTWRRLIDMMFLPLPLCLMAQHSCRSNMVNETGAIRRFAPLIYKRLVDQVAHQIAVRQAGRRRLHHEHDVHPLPRIVPEIGAPGAAPIIVVG